MLNLPDIVKLYPVLFLNPTYVSNRVGIFHISFLIVSFAPNKEFSMGGYGGQEANFDILDIFHVFLSKRTVQDCTFPFYICLYANPGFDIAQMYVMYVPLFKL